MICPKCRSEEVYFVLTDTLKEICECQSCGLRFDKQNKALIDNVDFFRDKIDVEQDETFRSVYNPDEEQDVEIEDDALIDDELFGLEDDLDELETEEIDD